MSRRVRIFVLFVDNVYRDVFASYSEAVRESGRYHGSTRIETVEREDY